MSNYDSVDDIRSDALRRAGEPQSPTSDFWTDSLKYINKIQHILLLGGGVAVGRDLATSAGIYAHLTAIPLTDWWFARKDGVLNTTAAISTGNVTVTQGSTAVTFSSAPSASVAGWRIEVASQKTIPKILTHAAASTSAVLDANWVDATQTAASYKCWQEKYDLAPDFLRFAGAPYLHSDYLPPINITSREQMRTNAPLQLAAEEAPTVAAKVGPRTIMFNSYDTTQSYRFEYEYITQPTDLVAGGVLLVPRHHRNILATGVAMLILADKNDSKAENLASEYREGIMRMVQEHRKMLSSGSNTFGQFKVRSEQGRRQRGRQPQGELFLV
jgi:hypothetical protein